jgi:peptide chain release factor subunit 1
MEKGRIEKLEPQARPRLKSVDPKIVKKTWRIPPDIEEADRATLRSLVEMGPGPRVLSIYVDLDPSLVPTPKNRQVEVTSLLDEAARRIEELDGQDRKVLRADVQRIRSYFVENPEWAKGAPSLAVFASGERGLFEIVRLSHPVPSGLWVEPTPYLEPVLSTLPARALCVALVDRAAARIFCGSEDGLEEISEFEDPVHGKHDQGGWSQARYQRSVEKSVDDHLKHVAARLLELHKAGQIRRIIVGCTEELLPRFLDHLHPYLKEHFAGRIEVDVQAASAEEVLEHSKPILVKEDQRHEDELFDRLRQEVAHKGRAAVGLRDCLEAINESRVEVLLAREGLAAPGVFGPRCGWLGLDGEEGSPCPVDGEPLEATDNIVELALERTVLMSGSTWVPRWHDDLEQWGGIAALLRF